MSRFHEDAAVTLIEAGVDHFRLADRLQQRSAAPRHHRGSSAHFAKIGVHRHIDFALVFRKSGIETEKSVSEGISHLECEKSPLLKL